MLLNHRIFHFGINFLIGLIVFAGMVETVGAQGAKKPERKKFGWSLKKKQKADTKITVNNPTTDAAIKLENAGAESSDAIKVNTDLILTDVLVQNKKGESIKGLDASDFVVIENGKPQEVEVFFPPSSTTTAPPRRFLLILDHNNGNTIHMRGSVDAARLFVDRLGPRDSMALVSDDVELLQDFTNDKDKLKKKLESVYKDYIRNVGRSGGHGHAYTALHTALNEMFDDPQNRPIVILQSNGQELHFLKGATRDATNTPYGLYTGFFNFTFQELLDKIIEKRVTVYSIVTGRRFAGLSEKEQIENLVLMQADNQYDSTPIRLDRIVPLEVATDYHFVRRIMLEALEFQNSLVTIAETSGGISRFFQTAADADTIYSDILADATNRYVLGYYSNSQASDKKRRIVAIEVRNHPEFVISARKSYFPR